MKNSTYFSIITIRLIKDANSFIIFMGKESSSINVWSVFPTIMGSTGYKPLKCFSSFLFPTKSMLGLVIFRDSKLFSSINPKKSHLMEN